MNTIVIVITMIFIIVGVVLLMSVGKWFTSCNLGLLVRRNVNCDYLHKILSG
ncbi:unnamed protein product [Schistosoma bovis]|nr:unnamed protein product [Schistosoma bovis]